MRKHPELLIQGTYTNLCIYKKSTNGKWAFDHVIEGYSAPTRRLEEDENGDFWLSKVPLGVIKLRLSENSRKIESQKPFDNPELKGGEVSTINQQIFVTSTKGVLKFNPNLQAFVPENELQNFSHGQIIRKIFPVLKNNLPSTNFFTLNNDGGLIFIDSTGKEKIIPIKKNQWVDDYENIVQIDAESFLICTENGFVFLPKQIILQKETHKIAKPLIRTVFIQDFLALNLTFRKPDEQPNLVFEYDQNNVTISFSTPNYGSSIKYSYLMENASKNWSLFQDITHKDFNNLPPNTYIFHENQT